MRHLLDRRSERLAQDGNGNPDNLFTTAQVADWLGVSTQWLEIGRSRGYGPPHIKLGARYVRYRRSDVLNWLLERARHAPGTAEHADRS